MTSSEEDNRLVISYILWAACFFGISGLHRIYNGRVRTGILWLCTWGLLGIGQFIDVFLIPEMVETQQLRKLRSRQRNDSLPYWEVQPVASEIAPLSRDEKMIKLARAAQQHGGEISVTQAVMDTDLGFDEVENLLKQMTKAGYVSVDNHPKTGVVVYRFDELLA